MMIIHTFIKTLILFFIKKYFYKSHQYYNNYKIVSIINSIETKYILSYIKFVFFKIFQNVCFKKLFYGIIYLSINKSLKKSMKVIFI